MANAGRILIMPKGNYDASVTYEMLDLVKHNGTSWLAKKTVIGIEPSNENEEYWQNMFDINIEDDLRCLRDDFVNKFKRVEVELDCPILAAQESTIIGNIAEYIPEGYEIFSITSMNQKCAYWNRIIVTISNDGDICATNVTFDGSSDTAIKIKLIFTFCKQEA